MKKLDEIVSILYTRGYLLKPCSEQDIDRIEREFKLKLPSLYREFLSIMGKGAGEFMLGSDCFYKNIFYLRQAAIELLEENNFRDLPNNSFVFWMHQGYQFAFFLEGEGDNSKIYYYTEVYGNDLEKKFDIICENFIEFLNIQLDEMLRYQ